MSDDIQLQAAVQLAEHYIELILSTNPELLIGEVAGAESEEVQSYVTAFTEFRQTLINNLAEQPLPIIEDDEDEYEEDEEEDEDEN